MTVQEAIRELHNIRPLGGIIPQKRAEAIDIAIECMEEVEQYRALGTVEELKEAREKQSKSDWIPCEERLPSEENEEYLVCKKNGCLMLLVWTKKGWNTYKEFYGKYYTECEINGVIAWMPKPQPYKKEGAENE